jgi:hypothetical protein
LTFEDFFSFQGRMAKLADASRKYTPESRKRTGRCVPQNSVRHLVEMVPEVSQGRWRNWQTR